MRVVALVSGGKDSCYSMQLCKQHGHDIVALANLLPEESAPDELDSFCFQTVGHQLIGAYSACMGLPLFRKRISGTSSVQDLGYSPTEGDEVEDLYQLLAYVKENLPGVQAVASGAIASDYQRLRVENVCSRLNLVSLAYLWHQPQRLLLRGMVETGVEAILVKVACLGLHPRKHLGRTISAMEPILLTLADNYGCNVCGEGGEYETMTLDCQVFTRGSIELDEYEIVLGTSDVGHLVPKSFRVIPKPGWEGCELHWDVRIVPGDFVAAPRNTFNRCSAPAVLGSQQQQPVAPATPALASNAIAAAAGGSHGAAAASAAAAAAAAMAACGSDPLLQPVAPSSFSVQVSMCSGPDYVQVVCRAVRPRSALPSDLTECDTTAALHALLVTAEQELAAQHMDLHHCLFVHLFLANMGHFQAANGVYCKHFPSRDPPSRACVQVCLPPDCPVMCEFLLARGAAAPTHGLRSSLAGGTGLAPPPPPNLSSPVSRHTRRVLHVQSISSWAPSCIGPYSQATSYRGLVYLAGVIPLDPPLMTLVPGDITAQVLRAMTSCEAVAVAQRTTVVGAALGLTVYLAAAPGSGTAGGGGGGAVSGGGAAAAAAAAGGGAALERSGANGGSFGSGSGGGAELRALTRAAVEALLEHGLPCYPYSQQRHGCSFGPGSAGGGFSGPGPGPAAYGGAGGGRYHRSSTCDSSSGLTTPRSATTTTTTTTSNNNGTWPGGSLWCSKSSAPGSRRAVLLGADGLDEEEEEAAAAAAAAAMGGGPLPRRATVTGGGQIYGAAAAASAVLDPYLQPPEVRVPVRPSVLYVTVPSLPRGSLVEIQPVCLDVEALAVIRKLTGHDSFVKRRNNSHHDAASLHQASHLQHPTGINAAHSLPAHAQYFYNNNNNNNIISGGGGGAGSLGTGSNSIPGGSVTSLSELPPTPRASMESLTGRDGGGGRQVHQHPYHHGSSPMQWQVSADLLGVAALASPLPSHMLSAAGFMSPDAGGSLSGTPSAGPSLLSRQRSSGLMALAGGGGIGGGGGGGIGGSLGGAGGSGFFHRCLSPSPQPPTPPTAQGMLPWAHAGEVPPAPPPAAPPPARPQLPGLQTPPHPPLSAQNSGHQLLSPTLHHLLQLQPSPQLLLQPLQQATAEVPPLQQLQQHLQQQQQHLQQQQQQLQPQNPTRPTPGIPRWQRLTSSNGGATSSAKDAMAAAVAAGLAPRTSYSGSSGSCSSSGALAHRNSLDGNILSFEVSSGRGGVPLVVSPQQSYTSTHSATAAEATAAAAAAGALSISSPATSVGAAAAPGGGGGHGTQRPRPAAITVPPLAFIEAAALKRSPFEAAVNAAAGAVASGVSAGGGGVVAAAAVGVAAPAVAALHAHGPPPTITIPHQSSGSCSETTPTPGRAPAAVPPGSDPAGPAVPATPVAVLPGGGGAAAARPPGNSSSSDVMVTTVCCYGSVLRSLFHLPPAVFSPGVTTAQLTRRFRRAAASVLAAHGMDMSCLIWVRVWYEKGAVEFTDDEYGAGTQAAAAATAAAATAAAAAAAAAASHRGPSSVASFSVPGGGGSFTAGPRVLHALEDDVEEESSRERRKHGVRRASASDESTSGGAGAAATVAAAAGPPPSVAVGTATSALGSGGSCSSPRPWAAARFVAAETATAAAASGAGAASPRCPGSPAGVNHRRLSGLQTDISPPDDRMAQHNNHHHQHHHHHQQHHQHQHQQQQQANNGGNGHSQLHPHSHHHHHHQPGVAAAKDAAASAAGSPHQQQQQHFHVSWVPVQRVATNSSPQPAHCVAVLELLAALPSP